MKLNIDNFINESEIKSLFKSLYEIPNRRNVDIPAEV